MTLPESILVESVALSDDQMLMVVTLNKPKALNALDKAMAEALLEHLTAWQYDDSVAAVLLLGQGEKAFCAGGDVVSMYNAMEQHPNTTPAEVAAFFTLEYELDHLIHVYAKPVIVLGQGYVMGGGMGLYAGASHRLVTPSTRLAMPEITIGLFPDVGGSYFLPRMPEGVGLFLGLTGVPFNGADALSIDFADAMVADNSAGALIEALKQQSALGPLDRGTIDSAIDALSIHQLPDSAFVTHQELFDQLGKADSLQQAMALITDYPNDDKWIAKAQRTMQAGSPITAHLVWQQIHRGSVMRLAECFQMELVMSCCCAAVGEFHEGVRALLIDKDGKPQWKYTSVDGVPAAFVDGFFSSPWTVESHPLAHLIKE